MIVGVTGISGYLGKTLLPLLEADPRISEIIGIDLRGPGALTSKLTFISVDIRNQAAIERAFTGCDVIIHLAYVVLEIRDKKATHDININGSKAVCEAAAKIGARKLIIASSIAAYGAHPDTPNPVPESWPARGNKRNESYYSYDKAQVEAYLDEFSQKHPDMVITRIRPSIFLGPRRFEDLRELWEPGLKLAVMPPEMPIDIVHEDDVARGFHSAVHHDVKGAVNLGSGTPMLYREFVELCGQRIIKVPRLALRTLADIAFRLGLSKSSSHWVNLSSYPIIPSIERAAAELDWRPTYSGKESLQAMLDAARAASRK